jgi:hypothetical protein
MVSAGLGLLH